MNDERPVLTNEEMDAIRFAAEGMRATDEHRVVLWGLHRRATTVKAWHQKITTPEWGEEYIPRCSICGKGATKRDIDGDWWPPCEHTKTHGISSLRWDRVSATRSGRGDTSESERKNG